MLNAEFPFDQIVARWNAVVKLLDGTLTYSHVTPHLKQLR